MNLQLVFARVIVAALLLLPGCGVSLSTLDKLASRGAINEQAPVFAHVQMEIVAPPEKVWALLADAPAWPRWHKDITAVAPAKPLSQGAGFSWTVDGTVIHSRVQLFEPRRRLAWTGQVYTVKAVHVWTLQPEPGGRTLVSISESMGGPLLTLLYRSSKLIEADTVWLADLKEEAEHGP